MHKLSTLDKLISVGSIRSITVDNLEVTSINTMVMTSAIGNAAFDVFPASLSYVEKEHL